MTFSKYWGIKAPLSLLPKSLRGTIHPASKFPPLKMPHEIRTIVVDNYTGILRHVFRLLQIGVPEEEN